MGGTHTVPFPPTTVTVFPGDAQSFWYSSEYTVESPLKRTVHGPSSAAAHMKSQSHHHTMQT